MLNRGLFFVGLFIFLSMLETANASEYDDWKAFQKAEKASFKQFQTEHDRAFVDFLNSHWEEFALFQGKVRDVTPKPAKAPSVKNWLFSNANELVKQKKTDIQFDEKTHLKKDFFGHSVPIVKTPSLTLPDLEKPNNKLIAQVWDLLSRTDQTSVIKQIQRETSQLQLGDWGVYLYLNHQLDKVTNSSNERVCYIWFLLSKLGYDVKISYDRKALYLLIASQNSVYGKTYVSIRNKSYYLMTPKEDASPIYSYPGVYESNSRVLQINFDRIVSPSKSLTYRSLSFPNSDGIETVKLGFDESRSDFLSQYPQIDLVYYFRAQPSQLTIKSLREQLGPLVEKLSERDAINLLLHLTQTGFRYATDDAQFGEENYLLAEESLRYPSNDCEDRSIFLAWLIKDLLGLDVIGLDYPGHVAIAVNTPVKQGDATINVKGRTFVVADPTYIGANLGMEMPSVQNHKPEVIVF